MVKSPINSSHSFIHSFIQSCFLQADMDLEQMVNMQPALYHRYNVDENEEEEDEDNEPFKSSFNPDSFHGTQVRDE